MIKFKIIEKTLGKGEIIPLTFDPIFTNIFNNEENYLWTTFETIKSRRQELSKYKRFNINMY